MKKHYAASIAGAFAIAFTAEPTLAHHDSARSHALSIAGAYVGEVMRATPDADGDETAFRALAEVEATLDLEALGLRRGGELHVRAQRAFGTETTGAVGAMQGVSGIEAAPFTGIASAWYQYGTPEQGLRVRIGWQDANTLFAAADNAGSFVHSSFGLAPSIGLPSYPDPALAAIAALRVSPGVDVGAGVFEGSIDAGPSSVAELRLHPAASAPAALRLGGWTRDSGGGVFLVAERPLISSDDVDTPLLRGFLQMAWASMRDDTPPLYLGAGLIRSAPLSFRAADEIGLGLAHVRSAASSDPAVATAETAAELFYDARLHDRAGTRIFVMPLMPHGAGTTRLVWGLRLTLSF